MKRAIDGEESLRRVSEIAAGSGLIKNHEREQILGAWRRDARLAARGDGPPTPPKLADMIGPLPIHVISKPKEGDSNGG